MAIKMLFMRSVQRHENQELVEEELTSALLPNIHCKARTDPGHLSLDNLAEIKTLHRCTEEKSEYEP